MMMDLSICIHYQFYHGIYRDQHYQERAIHIFGKQ